jgi:serine/threonine-protein kinase RsbW
VRIDTKIWPPIDRRALTLRWRTRIESSPHAINHAVREILHRARLAKVMRPEAKPEIEIALREALANAVFHGNDGDASKGVHIRVYGAPKWGLLLIVRDEGPGFRPESVPDPRDPDRLELPHGRGIFLMHELMDALDYRKDGREVILFKKAARRTRPTSGRTQAGL